MPASKIEGPRANRLDVNKIPEAEIRIYLKDDLIAAIHNIIVLAGGSTSALNSVLNVLNGCSPNIYIQASVGRYPDNSFGCIIHSLSGDIPSDIHDE